MTEGRGGSVANRPPSRCCQQRVAQPLSTLLGQARDGADCARGLVPTQTNAEAFRAALTGDGMWDHQKLAIAHVLRLAIFVAVMPVRLFSIVGCEGDEGALVAHTPLKGGLDEGRTKREHYVSRPRAELDSCHKTRTAVQVTAYKTISCARFKLTTNPGLMRNGTVKPY